MLLSSAKLQNAENEGKVNLIELEESGKEEEEALAPKASKPKRR